MPINRLLNAFCISVCVAGGLNNPVWAECSEFPTEPIDFQCSECTLPQAIWELANHHKHYNGQIRWSSDTPTQDFEVVVVNGSSENQVPWPFPLGQGLYATVQGNTNNDGDKDAVPYFEVSCEGCMASPVSFLQNNPTHQYGTAPLVAFRTDTPVTEATFRIRSTHAFYIMSTGEGEFEDADIQPPARLSMIVRAQNHNLVENVDIRDGAFVCADGPISIHTPCSITANPPTIEFGDLPPTSSDPNRLEKTDHSLVTVDCKQDHELDVHLKVIPANPPQDETNIATFTHPDGRPFHGLGLIYKMNEPPKDCESGDAWGESIDIGTTSKDRRSISKEIHWGLCRTDFSADTGEFETTATIWFWVD